MKIKRKTPGGLSSLRPPPNLWQIYEQIKAQLPPDLTPSQYELACRRITRLLRI